MRRTRPEGGARVVLWAAVVVLVAVLVIVYLYLIGAVGALLG